MSLNSALVVDDSKLARITLQRLLQKHNLSVEVAESGVVALEKLKSKKPDIIFMDHLMPDLDGFEATQKIKADPSTHHIPVIMCTGKEDTDNYDEQARGIGASGTLSKPPQADQLALILAAAQTGEQLVAASTAAGDNKVSTIASESTIEKSVSDSPTIKGSELAAVFERLNQLEQTSNRIPSADALQERLSTAENSLTTLQEAVISLKSDATEATSPSAEEISASVHRTLTSEFQQELANFKENAIDIEAIKAELAVDVESQFSKQLEDLSASLGAPADIDEETLIAKITANIENTLNEKLQSSSTNQVDEEALAARLAKDIENTLKPLFTEELKELEQKLASATDDAISESRRDLDEHLQDSMRSMEMNMKAMPEEANLEDLISKIRSEVADIATHSAAAAIEVSLEDRLSEINEAAKESVPAALDAQELINNPEMSALIQGIVEERLKALPISSGQETKTQTEENSGGANLQQIQELFDRVTELDRRQETLLDRFSEIKPQNSEAAGSARSGGLLFGVLALAGAAIALAKAFGLF